MEDPRDHKSHPREIAISHQHGEELNDTRRKPENDDSWVAVTATLISAFVFILLLLHWSEWPRTSNENQGGHGALGTWVQQPRASATQSETDQILAQLRENGTKPCHHEHTKHTQISGLDLPSDGKPLRLSTDTSHTFMMISQTARRESRCAGGDFYETQLESQMWKSRPPVEDFGNGSYGVTLIVDSDFAGLFTFTATLLFDCFHGLELMERPWDLRSQSLLLQILFYNEAESEEDLEKLNRRTHEMESCRAEHEIFLKKAWQGRWTRSWVNDSCSADEEGRFSSCVPVSHEPCSEAWCTGRVSRLESNSWVYSADCGFHIFEAHEAWDCLSGMRLLFWGDSNFQDTIRNLMLFVLDVPVPSGSNLSDFQLPRQFEEWIVNPEEPDQAFHVSMIFNGHYNVDDGDLGLDSLQNPQYREWISKHFRGQEATPDVVIMNSGLHDGTHFRTVKSFVEAVDRAISFWQALLNNPSAKRRKVIYRTTVAPAGESRGMQSNPFKMDIFNRIMVERLTAAIPSTHILDGFDLTFPFHYDYNYSDGGHYGRAPNVNLWPWFGNPHLYFVDLMLAHILLNAICPI